MKTKPRVLALITLGAATLTGCSSEPPPPPPPRIVYVPVPAQPAPAGATSGATATAAVSGDTPPAPVTEVRVVSPGPDYVWVDGVWVWNGSVWVWEPGRWSRPPYRGAVWVSGRSYYRHGRRGWIRGYWR